MASPQAIIAVIRAACPTFRSNHDRLAFAVHAAILSSGYRLVAVGEDAERAEGLPPDAPEVPVTGWDSTSGEQYTFAYLPDAEASPSDSGSTRPLLVKALVLGDTLLVSLASLGAAEGPAPEVLELDVNRYTTSDTSSIAKSFANLDELAKRITWALAALSPEPPSGAAKPREAAGGAKLRGGQRPPAAAETEAGAGERPGRMDEGRPGRVDESTPARPFFDMGPVTGPRVPFPPEGPMPHPLRAGEEDIMPPGGGFAPPSIPPGPSFPGSGIPPGRPFPGGGLGPSPGGGMHVGPHDPIFAGGDRAPHLPRGARWDPIGPQGLEGWEPDDFVQGGPGGAPRQPGAPPHIHPDIGGPPPGGGSNLDHMYG